MNIQKSIVDFLDNRKEIFFFRDPYTEMKAAALPSLNLFFDETDGEDVVVVHYEQVRIMFFLGTSEGKRLKEILDSNDFDGDEKAYEANRMSYRRLGDCIGLQVG